MCCSENNNLVFIVVFALRITTGVLWPTSVCFPHLCDHIRMLQIYEIIFSSFSSYQILWPSRGCHNRSLHLLFGNTNKHFPSLSPCTFSPCPLATSTYTTTRHSSNSLLLINSLPIYLYNCIKLNVMLAYLNKILIFSNLNDVCTNKLQEICVYCNEQATGTNLWHNLPPIYLNI